MHSRLGSASLSQLAFPTESNPNLPQEKFHSDKTVLKSKVFKKIHPAGKVGWVARLYRSWLSLGKSDPNSPWEKSQLDSIVVSKKSSSFRSISDVKVSALTPLCVVVLTFLY